MLNELVRRMTSRGVDRREAERIRKRYNMAWLHGGTLVPALGLEISEKGILFATREAPAGKNVDVAIDLSAQRVRARISIARKGPMQRDGVEWALIAGTFTGIAADDWDAIVRFCKNVDDPGNKAAQELSVLSHADDDAYRLLPLKVQKAVVAALIRAGRLAPESDPKNPLLRMTYGGKTRTGVHRLDVHSRRNDDDHVLLFDSVLSVDDAGNVTLDR